MQNHESYVHDNYGLLISNQHFFIPAKTCACHGSRDIIKMCIHVIVSYWTNEMIVFLDSSFPIHPYWLRLLVEARSRPPWKVKRRTRCRLQKGKRQTLYVWQAIHLESGSSGLSVHRKVNMRCIACIIWPRYSETPLNQTPLKFSICFLKQETLPSLLGTGWFQEWIRAWVHIQTKIDWALYLRLN